MQTRMIDGQLRIVGRNEAMRMILRQQKERGVSSNGKSVVCNTVSTWLGKAGRLSHALLNLLYLSRS
jgi:hypothetical protein